MEALDVPEPSIGASSSTLSLSSPGVGGSGYCYWFPRATRCTRCSCPDLDSSASASASSSGTDILILDGRQRPAASAHVVARQLEIAHILDRSCHISPASPCPSVLTAGSTTTWRDDVGKHNPDFRTFLPSRSPCSSSSSGCYSPPRASFDLPMPIVSASPPSKAERRAARRDLDPVLREAVRQLAQARRPSWLSRRQPQIDDDDFEDDDDGDYDTPVPETPKRAPRRDRIRLQLVSLELRVDLAVFRAKKRLRARFGLS